MILILSWYYPFFDWRIMREWYVISYNSSLKLWWNHELLPYHKWLWSRIPVRKLTCFKWRKDSLWFDVKILRNQSLHSIREIVLRIFSRNSPEQLFSPEPSISSPSLTLFPRPLSHFNQYLPIHSISSILYYLTLLLHTTILVTFSAHTGKHS